MKIKKITRQHRRDFYAIYQCEHCGHETDEKSGYDDRNYHDNVIPKMECPECGETAPDTYRGLSTKHPEHKTV